MIDQNEKAQAGVLFPPILPPVQQSWWAQDLHFVHMKHKALFCLQSDIWHLFTHNKKKSSSRHPTVCGMWVLMSWVLLTKDRTPVFWSYLFIIMRKHRMISITVSRMILTHIQQHMYMGYWKKTSQYFAVLHGKSTCQHIFKIIFISYHNTVISHLFF